MEIKGFTNRLVWITLLFCASCNNNGTNHDNSTKEFESSNSDKEESTIVESNNSEKGKTKNGQEQWWEDRIREANTNVEQRDLAMQKEREKPYLFIDLDTEMVRKERLFSSKFMIKGTMISKAKYGSYSPVWIKVFYYSKNDIVLGSEIVKLDICVSGQHEKFSFKVKPPRKTSHYKCIVCNAKWEQFDI